MLMEASKYMEIPGVQTFEMFAWSLKHIFHLFQQLEKSVQHTRLEERDISQMPSKEVINFVY